MLSVFTWWKWKYQYKRFQMKWSKQDIDNLIDQQEFIKGMFSLLKNIPLKEWASLYQPEKQVRTYCDTVEEFEQDLIKAARWAQYDNLQPQPSINTKMILGRDYYLSKDGRVADYTSAILNISRRLERLYQEVWKKDTDLQDYYYRQLKEMFVCGIALCLQHVNEYAR